MSEISNLKPQRLWQIFDHICTIPHPSYHEEAIRNYVVDFGRKLGLETQLDEADNILIKKPATAGYEDKPGIILQAHVDMVPQKNKESQHDFTKDPILPRIVEGRVYATDTTLGADNGIGCAAMLAVLEDTSLEHPAIECLFTATEEAGMDGAKGLKAGFLQGKYLINLDSEDEGEIFVGCAGGIDVSATFKVGYQEPDKQHMAFKISITGLQGGHSGDDIKLGRGNANKILFLTLNQLQLLSPFMLYDIQSGGLRNAIPREGEVYLTMLPEHEDTVRKFLTDKEKELNANFKGVEQNIKFNMEAQQMPQQVFAGAFQTRLIQAVLACPNDVYRWCLDLEGVVETSNNLSSINHEDGKIEIKCLTRSSVDSRKDELAAMIRAAFELAGAYVEFSGEYAGWEPKMDSALLETVVAAYKERFKVDPEIKIIHAGLECGIIGAVYPDLEMTSFGPTIKNPHSPTEYVDIETVDKFWLHLTDCLRKIS